MRVASRIALATAFLLAMACDLPDPFAGYRETEHNFIAGTPLAPPPEPSSDADLNGSGFWDFAWRNPATANFPYMKLTQETSEAGPIPAVAVFRLELVNLYDGGDFESATVGGLPSGWGNQGSANVQVVSSGLNGHGKSLTITKQNESADWAGFPVSALKDTNVQCTKAYVINFFAGVLSSTSGYSLQNQASYDQTKNMGPITAGDNINTLALWSTSGATSEDYILFGGPASMSLTIDELRVLRGDLGQDSRLRLRLRRSDTKPPLSPGYYEFRLWIKKPSNAKWHDEARTTEPPAARTVGIRLSQLDAQGKETATPIPITERAVTDAWQEIVARGQNIDLFHDTTDAPVIELSIWPFAAGKLDAGAVLIAAPVLRYYLDGYQ